MDLQVRACWWWARRRESGARSRVQAGAAGARVVLAARRADELAEAARRPATGAATAVCDVRDPTQCDAVVRGRGRAARRARRVVYATAVDPLVRLVDTDLDRWRQVFETNVFGASLVTPRRAGAAHRVGWPAWCTSRPRRWADRSRAWAPTRPARPRSTSWCGPGGASTPRSASATSRSATRWAPRCTSRGTRPPRRAVAGVGGARVRARQRARCDDGARLRDRGARRDRVAGRPALRRRQPRRRAAPWTSWLMSVSASRPIPVPEPVPEQLAPLRPVARGAPPRRRGGRAARGAQGEQRVLGRHHDGRRARSPAAASPTTSATCCAPRARTRRCTRCRCRAGRSRSSCSTASWTRCGAHSDVPVAPMIGYEPDPAVLGTPFFVMGFVDGAGAGRGSAVHDRGVLPRRRAAPTARAMIERGLGHAWRRCTRSTGAPRASTCWCPPGATPALDRQLDALGGVLPGRAARPRRTRSPTARSRGCTPSGRARERRRTVLGRSPAGQHHLARRRAGVRHRLRGGVDRAAGARRRLVADVRPHHARVGGRRASRRRSDARRAAAHVRGGVGTRRCPTRSGSRSARRRATAPSSCG